MANDTTQDMQLDAADIAGAHPYNPDGGVPPAPAPLGNANPPPGVPPNPATSNPGQTLQAGQPADVSALLNQIMAASAANDLNRVQQLYRQLPPVQTPGLLLDPQPTSQQQTGSSGSSKTLAQKPPMYDFGEKSPPMKDWLRSSELCYVVNKVPEAEWPAAALSNTSCKFQTLMFGSERDITDFTVMPWPEFCELAVRTAAGLGKQKSDLQLLQDCMRIYTDLAKPSKTPETLQKVESIFHSLSVPLPDIVKTALVCRAIHPGLRGDVSTEDNGSEFDPTHGYSKFRTKLLAKAAAFDATVKVHDRRHHSHDTTRNRRYHHRHQPNSNPPAGFHHNHHPGGFPARNRGFSPRPAFPPQGRYNTPHQHNRQGGGYDLGARTQGCKPHFGHKHHGGQQRNGGGKYQVCAAPVTCSNRFELLADINAVEPATGQPDTTMTSDEYDLLQQESLERLARQRDGCVYEATYSDIYGSDSDPDLADIDHLPGAESVEPYCPENSTESPATTADPALNTEMSLDALIAQFTAADKEQQKDVNPGSKQCDSNSSDSKRQAVRQRRKQFVADKAKQQVEQ